ncbi:alpha/beta hydrolase [Marinomonas sp.]|nr:alpha/beta hydrolase [Marinomonas sp.]MDB4837512.1 alpha/beta hydrolase [Marinomonas sp.]
MNSLQNWTLMSEKEDHLSDSFIARTFMSTQSHQPVHATLIHHIANSESDKAILYVHGYTDYFFQVGLAEHFIALGYRFYAIDLRGYGRSLRPSRPPTWCDSVEEYSADLELALSTMKQDGISDTVILAHSTGALIVSSYLVQAKSASLENDNTRPVLAKVSGLIFNSPFLALPFSPAQSRWLKKPIQSIVSTFPWGFLRAKKAIVYAKSLHSRFEGEWHYRLDWKPDTGFDLSFYWLKEIIRAQDKLANQKIGIPTLLCRSAISTIGKSSVEEMQQGDGVLNVDSMEKATRRSFTDLTINIIPQGFHDLYLSKPTARQAYLEAMSNWLKAQEKTN